MLMRHKMLLASAIMTLAQLAYAQTSTTILPEPPTPAPPTAAPPESNPMPSVTPPDVPPVPPSAPQEAPVQPPSSGGAIITPAAPEHAVTGEHRALTETDTDPYIQRRIARKKARTDYKAAKQEAREEYLEEKREADARFNAMRQAQGMQSPRGELGADYLGNNYYGSTGQ